MLATYLPKDDLNRSDIILIGSDGSWVNLVGHPDRRAERARPSGEHIAYVFEDEGRFSLYVTDLDGSDHRRLAGGDVDFGGPAWLPDGSGLVAKATNRGQTDLLTVDLDGGVAVLARGGDWGAPGPGSAGVVATHESWGSPPRLKLVVPGGEERWLFDGAPVAIRSAAHVIPERVTYKSLDGLEIEGFLFKPADTSRPVPRWCTPMVGPRITTAMNGTGKLSISSRGATPGWPSTSAGLPHTVWSSSAQIMATAGWATPAIVSPPACFSAAWIGSTPIESQFSAPVTAPI